MSQTRHPLHQSGWEELPLPGHLGFLSASESQSHQDLLTLLCWNSDFSGESTTWHFDAEVSPGRLCFLGILPPTVSLHPA